MDMSDNTEQQWETELNVTLDVNTWGSICPGCHKGVGVKYGRSLIGRLQ